ncbi:hypothetical protein PENNAL_c0023G10835 [Penicillium nalgiovense]|uniref:Uncharacterized protein n=1 Tax=Penicillium nalgiovense TaxID=60175 RepID=A0A1V6YE31_PENNA|nr:hypothetical protein PENNAL_c0023G10835 [Penicillium nalgiovense]
MSRVTDSVYPVSAQKWKWDRSEPRDWAALRREPVSLMPMGGGEGGESLAEENVKEHAKVGNAGTGGSYESTGVPDPQRNWIQALKG